MSILGRQDAVQVKRTDRWAVESDVSAALEDPVEDGLGKVVVVQDATPRRERLVRREHHRPLLEVAFVDDVKEHVRGVFGVGEVADLVDNQQVGVCVPRQGLFEAALVGGRR